MIQSSLGWKSRILTLDKFKNIFMNMLGNGYVFGRLFIILQGYFLNL